MYTYEFALINNRSIITPKILYFHIGKEALMIRIYLQLNKKKLQHMSF